MRWTRGPGPVRPRTDGSGAFSHCGTFREQSATSSASTALACRPVAERHRPTADSDERDDVDLTYVLTTLRRAWWLLALAAVLGTGAAALVNATSAVTYQAQVQQFVSIADTSDTQSNILSGSQFTLQRVKSYTQVATSAQVLGPVIQQLKLPMTSGELARNVTVTNPLDTVLIEIAVTDTDPNRAADVANGVAKQLSRVVQDIESPQSGAP